MTPAPGPRRGTTVVELLCLLSALSLLVAVGVPDVLSADRARLRHQCVYRLGVMAQAANYYSQNSDGWILGSPNTSGAYLTPGSAYAYGPAVQVWDFMGPLAEFFQLGFTLPPNQPGNTADVIERFNQIRNSNQFRCPSNDFMASHFAGPNAGTGPMISYNTVRYQLFKHDPSSFDQGITAYNNSHAEAIPVGYQPLVNSMGNPSQKVWLADGARYSSVDIPPDYDLGPREPWGDAFSDQGPYSIHTRSWDRSRAPGNGYTGPVEARRYAFRHSDAEPPVGAAGDAFKLNVAFYDGHVETQGDLTATNPHQWLPTGSTWNTVSAWEDSRQFFSLPSSVVIN